MLVRSVIYGWGFDFMRPFHAGAKFALLRLIFLPAAEKQAVRPIPCFSSFTKNHASLAGSVANVLTTARCRYPLVANVSVRFPRQKAERIFCGSGMKKHRANPLNKRICTVFFVFLKMRLNLDKYFLLHSPLHRLSWEIRLCFLTRKTPSVRLRAGYAGYVSKNDSRRVTPKSRAIASRFSSVIVCRIGKPVLVART